MTTTTLSVDRCRLPPAFWKSIERLGLRPSAVLQQASLPATLHLDETAFISTSQLFSIWRAIEAISGDPAFGIRMACETSSAQHMMAFVSALYAANYRDGLERVVRYKRLCSPDRLLVDEKDGKIFITSTWPGDTEPEPYISVEASFALLIELGRRGTGQRLLPSIVELRRHAPDGISGTDLHTAYFGCRIHFGAGKDRMILEAAHLALPFIDHNPEMLRMVSPALAAALREFEAEASFENQVKAALRRAFAAGRSDIATVARELGLSERTMQRRITAEGKTFRMLLNETRRELGRQLLSDLSVDVKEVAFLLGYQDNNSFYRAFREWENATPLHWRRMHAHGFSAVFRNGD
ncbi:AraC family transcriptional regulator [Pseudoduganella albidiflava]|uniref:AraC family transcriptional regulator n=3 Tax=Pseudoduganella albidiflava TaxID=321983 RepID=A0ABX5S533_9BURK|nr:AraC family transcriptional regulator [Pseudoduganella albidiflava]